MTDNQFNIMIKSLVVIIGLIILLCMGGCAGNKVMTGKQTVKKTQKAHEFRGFKLKHLK